MGSLFEVLKGIGPYASASTSFAPVSPTTRTFTGAALDPETALQYEVGAKASLFGDKLLLSGCWYLLKKGNAVVTDTDHPGFAQNGGRIHSAGVELDVVGTPVTGLNLIGSLADTRTRVVASNALPVGAKLRGVPAFTGSLWAKYVLQRGFAQGLGVGMGVAGATSKRGDDKNTFELPGYATLDASVSYEVAVDGHRGTLQLNVSNLTNATYYQSSLNSGRVMPGRPIDVLGSFHVQY